MPLVIVRLSGGFGNQLFQYLFGVDYAAKRDLTVVFDATDSVLPNAVRPLKLIEFGLPGTFIRADRVYDVPGKIQLNDIDVLQGDLTETSLTLPIGREAGFDYAPPPEFKSGGYLDGYWQSYRYWEDPSALAALAGKAIGAFKLNAKLEKLAAAMKKGDATAIHVRRGDYVTPFYKQVHGICLPEYYRGAVADIEGRKGPQRLFVFTDDIAVASEIFGDRQDVTLVSEQTRSDLEDFVMMSFCDSFVISNSSFSYLAATFAQTPPKAVVGPYPWFTQVLETPDLFPGSWTTLNRATGATREQDEAVIKAATVSVVIPTMDRYYYLPTAVKTALDQTLKPIEVFISLNGSPPEGREMADKLARQYPEVRVVEHPEALLSRARNNALKQATGEWVAFLDDDDVWDEEKLEIQVRASVILHAEVVACDYDKFDHNGTYDVSNLISLHGREPWAELLTTANAYSGGSAVLARRDAIEFCGRFDEALVSCEDHDMWRRLALRGFTLVFLDKKLAHYQQNRDNSNMTKNHRLMLAGEFVHLGRIIWQSDAIRNVYVQQAFERLLVQAVIYFGAVRKADPKVGPASRAPWIERLAEEHGGQLLGLYVAYDELRDTVDGGIAKVRVIEEMASTLADRNAAERERGVRREVESLRREARVIDQEVKLLNLEASRLSIDAENASGGRVKSSHAASSTTSRRPFFSNLFAPLPSRHLSDAEDAGSLSDKAGEVRRRAGVLRQERAMVTREAIAVSHELATLAKENELVELERSIIQRQVKLAGREAEDYLGNREGGNGGSNREKTPNFSARTASNGTLERFFPSAGWRSVAVEWRACKGERQKLGQAPLTIETPDIAWDYAAMSDQLPLHRSGGPAILEVSYGQVSANIGISLCNRDGSTLLSEEFVRSSSACGRRLFLDIPLGTTEACILIRNYDAAGRGGALEIEGLRLLTQEAATGGAVHTIVQWVGVDVVWRGGAGSEEMVLPLRTDMPEAAWAYAMVSEPIQVADDLEAHFELTLIAEGGYCGAGLVSEDASILLSAEAILTPGEISTVHFTVPRDVRRLRLMTRNLADSGLDVSLEIFKLRLAYTDRPEAQAEAGVA